MGRSIDIPGGDAPKPDYARIARRIGLRLRETFGRPEEDPLPVEHVDLLLKLRQKERERARAAL